MNRDGSRENLNKVLRRIEKSEEKGLKLLAKQRKDLLKALEDNGRLIEASGGGGGGGGGRRNSGVTKEEAKLEAEAEKLARVRKNE